MKSEDIESGPAEIEIDPENVDPEKVNHDKQDLPKAGNENMKPVVVQDSNKAPPKTNKTSTKPRGRAYLLQSPGDGARVLRSRTNATCKTQSESVTTPVNPITKRSKRRRKINTTSTDDYSMARKRIRYLLNRMNYEQSLIDAYAGEGWKGQSAEKIRPEKELERARSEILRCKLKIRDLFRHLDSLSSEGRFEESLFDSEGQICSEDIFCAKCCSKDLSTDNDIILCDGGCDRGFHQKCLNPPLLSADIPVGEALWLCPACNCKVDFIHLLNESQGSDVSIVDTWEKVFPEAASLANGYQQSADFPSDDSEDHEYDPDCPEVDVDDHGNETDYEEQSDSDDSDFTSPVEDSDASECPKQNENIGFTSHSEDKYDPYVPDPNKVIQKDGSSSDESDFTSDSDDFCKEISKTSRANEERASSLLKSERGAEDKNYSSLNSEILSTLEGDWKVDNVLVSGKRQIERLDYRKKYDEIYGALPESSEDEDWFESAIMSTPKKRKKNGIRKGSHVLSKANVRIVKNRRSSRSDIGKLPETKAAGEKHHGFLESDSNFSKSYSSVNRRLGSITSQKLYGYFEENQYPSQEKKESLAQELGLSVCQVNKWFENTCRSASVEVSNQAGIQDKENSLNKTGGNNINPRAVGESLYNEGNGEKLAVASDVAAEHNSKLAEGEIVLKLKPDGVMGQISSSKGKNSVPATKSVGTEYDSIPDDTSGRSSSTKEQKGKDLVPASRSMVRAGHGRSNGSSMEVDKERQKAIARELRRMKQRR